MREPTNGTPPPKVVRRDPWYVRVPLILGVAAALTVLVVVPLVNVFAQALDAGWGVVAKTLAHRDTLAALRLTLVCAAVAVSANLTFGLAAAWAVARFRFPGKALLVATIDLPFAVSPVVAGLCFVLLFGVHGFLGPFVKAAGVPVIFNWPGIALVTTFVTFPFIARELIPVMEAVGDEEEQAARTLGAGALQMFWHVTLPNVKWGLLYGLVLCNARAMGEFGAVSVVAGRVGGRTETLPIYIEKLNQGLGVEARAAAFTVAALLACLALVTLLLKSLIEWKARAAGAKPAAGDGGEKP